MSRRKRVEVTDQADVPEVTEPVVEERAPATKAHVTVHLDRDPNDPRNRPETKALPSLDEEE